MGGGGAVRELSEERIGWKEKERNKGTKEQRVTERGRYIYI